MMYRYEIRWIDFLQTAEIEMECKKGFVHEKDFIKLKNKLEGKNTKITGMIIDWERVM